MDDRYAEALERFPHRFEPGEDDRALALLLLHGTGGDENDLLPLGRMLAPGATLLSPRGRVLENGMPRFFRRLAEGVFDEPDLIVRTHELAEFVIAARSAHGLENATWIAAGFSNGANIAASLLLLRPGVLRGAILFRPMVPLVPEPLPALAGTDVFMAAGSDDPIVPASESERLADLLRRSGASVSLRWGHGGHSIGRDEIEAARRWLARVVASSVSPG